jgi:ATP-binding cassette subfamily B protein
MNRWRAFGRWFGGLRRVIALSVALAVAQSVLLVPVALVIRHIFDDTIPAGDSGELVLLGGVMLVLYVSSAALMLWTRWLAVRATKAAVVRLRRELLDRLYARPSTWFDRRDVGTLQSTIVQDSERLDTMSTALIALFLPSALIAAALAGVLAYMNLALFLLMAAVLPLLVVVSRLLARRVRTLTRAWQSTFDAYSAGTLLALRSMRFVRSHGLEDTEIARRGRVVDDLGDSGWRVGWSHALFLVVHGAVPAVAAAVVIVAGGVAVIEGRLTLGELLSAYTLIALLRGQAFTLLVAAPMLMTGWESLERLENLLEETDIEPYTGTRRVAFSGAVRLENVVFGYLDAEPPLLRDVSLTLEPGEVVALTGPNGAGKSTIARLMLGLYRPWSGRVLADGVPFDELDLRPLRRRLSVVEQAPWFAPTSIAENIGYALEAPTDADVREAARLVGADAFVERLPDGYETLIGDEAALLSGGERQRLALARAVAPRPALLILDEPTTSLDGDAVVAVVSALRVLPSRPAILAITHSDVVTRAADRVYHLRNGVLLEVGRAAELAVATEQS